MNEVFEEIWALKDEYPEHFRPVMDTLKKAFRAMNGASIEQESILKKQLESVFYDVLFPHTAFQQNPGHSQHPKGAIFYHHWVFLLLGMLR